MFKFYITLTQIEGVLFNIYFRNSHRNLLKLMIAEETHIQNTSLTTIK